MAKEATLRHLELATLHLRKAMSQIYGSGGLTGQAAEAAKDEARAVSENAQRIMGLLGIDELLTRDTCGRCGGYGGHEPGCSNA